jgi:DNA-directed RNA polymerase subunit RPC12/RpoP
MPIQFECSACGKKIKAPDENVGKKARCPYCKSVIVVPEGVYDAEEVAAPGTAEPESYGLKETPGPAPSPVREDRQPCPMCGEMILADAVKCRYCGEIFDEDLKRSAKRKKRSADPSDKDLAGGEILLAVLCSGIACIVGIVWMIQGKPKGIKMVGLSLLFSVIWSTVRFAIEMGLRH